MLTIAAVFFLVFLEISLSLDNALVLAVLVAPLPEAQRQKALCYGMWGAFGFRVLAVCLLSFLLHLWWIKILAAAYLIYLAGKHFVCDEEDDKVESSAATFWKTILMVELADIAFSMDSIFAGVGVSAKPYIVIAGGILGIIFMRFVAFQVSKIINRFPWLQDVAYVFVGLIGFKLIIFR